MTVILTVIVDPGSADDGTTNAVDISTIAFNEVTAVAVLLARVGSTVVLVTAALKVCTVVLAAGTVYGNTTKVLEPDGKLGITTV